MGTQSTMETKKSFFQNDRLLVCGMLAIYSACILGCIGTVLGGLHWRNQEITRSTTKTAVALSTQEAKASATAIVVSTKQAQYEFIDRFDSYKGEWEIGATDSEYWTGYRGIKNGVYGWDVYKVKKNFISWQDFEQMDISKDFDVYVDTKVEKGRAGDVCSGFVFRLSPVDFDGGGYMFSVCNNSYFQIVFKNVHDGWEYISDWQYSPYIHPSDWNRLEIKARGSQFEFFANGQSIFKMEDESRSSGGIALLIDVDDGPARIVFDNFGYQSR